MKELLSYSTIIARILTEMDKYFGNFENHWSSVKKNLEDYIESKADDEYFQKRVAVDYREIERRIEAGLDPVVESVASLFISRWDVAANPQLPAELQHKLGIAVAGQTYRAYCALFASQRWLKLAATGARPQRLLWASTGTKDPAAPDTLYIEGLAAPNTINTLPEKTLLAFADHGKVSWLLPADGGDAEAVIEQFRLAGINVDALAEQLQREGVAAFATSWHTLLTRIREKSAAVADPQ